MGKTNELEIRILAKNLAKEALADARKDLQGVGDAAKKGGADAKEGSKGIGDMVGALQKAASAYALVKVAQQAIEWAKEGAAIDAVEKRFVAFAGSAAAAEGILRAVSEATGGTIDRMSTMQSASKLMSMGLANNAEEVARLVEMATKLGDQTQATGDRVSAFGMMLANQSIEVLDNYGISSGQVRERIKELMAATAGMTREQAFLQATLELGEKTLIRLGDSTENMAASWDRLGATIADGTGKFKQLVAEGLTPAAEGLYQVLSFFGRVNDALALNSDEAIASGQGWEEYAKAQMNAHYAAGRGNAVLREVNKALRENGERVLYHTATSENWNYVIEKATEYGIGFGETLDRISYDELIAESEAAAEVVTRGATAWGAYDLNMRLAAKSARDAAGAVAQVSTKMLKAEELARATDGWNMVKEAMGGAIGKAAEGYVTNAGQIRDSMEEIRGKVYDLRVEQEKLPESSQRYIDITHEISGLEENYSGLITKLGELGAAHEKANKRALLGMLEQRMALDGLSTDEQDALTEMAGAWGLIDDATLKALRGTAGLVKQFDDGTLSVNELGQGMLDLISPTDEAGSALTNAAGVADTASVNMGDAAEEARTLRERLDAVEGGATAAMNGMANMVMDEATAEMSAAAEAARLLRERLDALQSKTITVDVVYNAAGLPSATVTGPGGQETKHEARAQGGMVRAQSWALVGEQGPELAYFPQGAEIFAAQESKRMLQNGGGATVYAPVTIHANVANGVDVALLARQVSDEIGRRVANRRNF